jgi:hypothetical protein
MLEVTKILEGGLDLRTGQELHRGLVITNGRTEVIISIPPEKMEEVVGLIASEFGVAAPRAKPQVVKVPNTYVAPISQSAEVFEDTPVDPIEDEGFKPGEEYVDSDTGLDSL